MYNVCKEFVAKMIKKLRTHLRSIYSSFETKLMPPTGHVRQFDKDNYKTKYPNYKKQHQRHEQKK